MDYNIIQGYCTVVEEAVLPAGVTYKGSVAVNQSSYKDKGIYICTFPSILTPSDPGEIFLNINGLGNKHIYSWIGGDILLVENGNYLMMYVEQNGGYFICLNQSVGA